MILSNGCYLKVAVDTVCQVMQLCRMWVMLCCDDDEEVLKVNHMTCVFTVGHHYLLVAAHVKIMKLHKTDVTLKV